MSQTPAWILSLKKSNRVLKDNDHVYASLEVIKAQYNRYDQDGKIRLPHFERFNEEQTNTYWAEVFSSDEDADMFISEVKRKYQPKGLDATIDRLRFYQQDDFKGWRNISEIRKLTTGPNRIKGPKITARVTKVVNELLPFLEGKKKTGKQTAGTKGGVASGLARINVEMQDVTKEKINSVLQENFDTWNENQQKRYLAKLDRLLLKDKTKIDKLKPYFTQNYGRKMIPLLNQWGWNRQQRITVKPEEDLSQLGFEKKGPHQIIPSYEGDVNELKRKVKEIIGPKKIENKPRPVYSLFGKLDMVEYSKDDTKGMIFKEYEVVEPFTSTKAHVFLEKVMKEKEYEKLNAIKERSGFIHRSLLKILDGKYESMIEDGSMADNFILNMQTMKFANEKYRLNYYARSVYNASYKGDINNDFYSEIIENRIKEDDKPTFDKYKNDIVNALKSRGSLKDSYEKEKETLQRNLKFIERSISPSQKEFIDRLLGEESEALLQDIPERESEQSTNQKRILELIQDLSGKELGLREKELDYGDKKVNVVVIAIQSVFEKVTELLDLVGLEPEETELRFASDDLKEDFKDEMDEFDRVLQVYGKIFDVDFDESKFSEGHEQDIAEIAYRGLASGHGLDEILSGEVIKDQMDDLDNLYNVIVSAGRIYIPSEQEGLDSLTKTVQPSEDIDITESPFATEIKKVAKIIKDIIPKLRQEITQDIKDKLEKIVSESLTYQQQRGAKSKRNFLRTLENKGLIRAVE